MKISRPRPLGIALTAGLVACGSAHTHDPSQPARAAAAPLHVPAKDSFSGHVAQASGRLAGDRGNVKVLLQPGAGVGVRQVTITVTGALAGALRGELTQHAGLPDVGRTFSITASGSLKPLGRVTAIGTATGVGNARFGHESLRVTLRSTAGSLVVSATSPQVPAFTSP